MRKFFYIFLFIVNAFGLCRVASAQGTIFFATQGGFFRAVIDPEAETTVGKVSLPLTGFTLSSETAVAVDSESRVLYLVGGSQFGSGVYSANFDGAEATLISGTDTAVASTYSIAIAQKAQLLFVVVDDPNASLTEPDRTIIKMLGTTGQSVQTLDTGDTILAAKFLAFDEETNTLYWSEPSNFQIVKGTVSTADATITGITQFYSDSRSLPYGITIDLTERFLYWSDVTTDPQLGGINRKSLDDTDPATSSLLYSTNPQETFVGQGLGITINPESGELYWTDSFNSDVYLGDRDGASSASVLFSNALDDQNSPSGIVFVPARTITPDDIPDAPVVTVNGRDITLEFEEIDRARLSISSRRGINLAARRRAGFKYRAIIERTEDTTGNPVTNDILRRVTKRNQLTLSGLTPGRYTAKYRILFTQRRDGRQRVVDRGEFSPAATFTINE